MEYKIIFSQAYCLQSIAESYSWVSSLLRKRKEVRASGLYYNHETLLNYHSTSPHSVFILATQVCVFMYETDRGRQRETNRDRRQRHRDKENILDLYPSEFWEIPLHYERKAFTDPTQSLCPTPDPSHTSCVSELRSDGLVPLGAIVLFWKSSLSDTKCAWPLLQIAGLLLHTEDGVIWAMHKRLHEIQGTRNRKN